MIKVCQSKPYVDLKDYEFLKSSFEDNWITEGPKSKEFIEKICKITGTKYGALAPNGTLALYLALRALGIGPGDKVIVPNFTFIASANAVEMTGATPLFVDININNLQIDLSKCYSLLKAGPKAIMPVPLYGLAPDMNEIKNFAKYDDRGLCSSLGGGMERATLWQFRGCGLLFFFRRQVNNYR